MVSEITETYVLVEIKFINRTDIYNKL